MERRRGTRGRYVVALAALALLTRCGGTELETEAQELEAPRLQEAALAGRALATTHTFNPSADTWVEEEASALNHGLASNLSVAHAPRRALYLRFRPHLKGRVTRAVLRLYATRGSGDAPQLFPITESWSEEGLTWRNRPRSQGRPVAEAGSVSSGTWVEYDVTGQVQSGVRSFSLLGTANAGATFLSREAGQAELRPQLVVTVLPEPAGCLPRTDTYFRAAEASMDGSVSQSEPERNFGLAPMLSADGVPRQESYLQFEVNTGGLAVRQAWLELQATSTTSSGPRLYRTENQWTERKLTWNTRPALAERPLGDLGSVSTQSRVTFDLTGTVADSEFYSFGLIAKSGDSVAFASSEGASEGGGPALHYVLESPSFCSYRGTGGGLGGWVRQHGGSGHDELDAMARHPEGGFVAAGRFGEAAFPQGEGLALARYSTTGSTLWSRVVVTEKVRVSHLTVTPLGNILVVGNYHGSPNLGTGSLPFIPEEESWAGFFIAKFSPRGDSVWAHGFASRGDLGRYQMVAPYAVATDANGSLIVTGIFSGEMNLGGQALKSNAQGRTGYSWGEGGFVAKFSWEGHPLWSRAFQSGDERAFSGYIYGSAVSADEEGNVLVGGSASASTDLGDGRLRHRAPFLAKYSPTGSLLWKRVLKGAYGEVADVKPQGSGSIAFTGNFGDAFHFAGKRFVGGDPEASYPEVPNTNGFIGAMTASGEDVWMTSVGTGTGFSLWFNELAVSEDGSLTVSGQGEGVFDLGGGSLGFSLGFSPYFSTRRGFVARYSPQGQHQWSRVLDHERDFKVALQPGGGVLLGTSLAWELELEGTTRRPQGTSDLLYLRVEPTP